MKQVIFNVGGALSTYIEFYDKKLLIDLGKSEEFNPIKDFLLPLFQIRNETKNQERKYLIDQLIISHPHNDHISAIGDFYQSFHPVLLTCPNDKVGMEDVEKINWSLFEDNPNIDILKKMLLDRKPPLEATNPTYQFIYYIPAKNVEYNEELTTESYCNNISIAVYLRINGTKIFLPGDIMKNGMTHIIKRNSGLRNKLAEGIDILIAPHHGLRSSFSQYLFDHIKNNKTRCLNIISEKATPDDSVRQIDTRYSSTDYCCRKNNFSKDMIVCQKKTSVGHIYIDYSNFMCPYFEIICNNTVLTNKFL